MSGAMKLADVALPQFQLEYAGPSGPCEVAIEQAATVAFEFVAPVRAFARYRGQRSNTGLWWSATTNAHVGFESWLERDHVMLLDFDPQVAAIAAQPFRLRWDDTRRGRGRGHVPDFFARLTDGTGVVVDVRPASRVPASDAAIFAATGAACKQAGWRYRLVHEPDPVLAANVRWLAGYRRSRGVTATLAAAAPVVFAEPLPLMQGAERLGDPLLTLPVVFHLLWRGQLSTNLSQVLCDSSPVRAVQR